MTSSPDLPFSHSQDTPARDQQNQHRLRSWSLAWAASFLAATAALRFEVFTGGIAAVLMAAVTAALLVGMVVSYRRFLLEADELRRKIELDALATAFGVGLVVGHSYWLLKLGGVVPEAVVESDLLYLWALMVFTYLGGVLVGRRRYS